MFVCANSRGMFNRKAFQLLAAAVAVAISVDSASASTLATWTNSSGNTLYNTASNWSTNVVPNGDYAVTVGLPSPTILDTTVTITSLDVLAGGDFRISNGQSLTLTQGRTMILAGSILINPEGSGAVTALNLPNFDVTLTGGGEIVLNSDTSSINNNGAFLNLPAGMNIRGRGTINAVVISQGTISADQNGGTLTFLQSPGNGGLLKATNGGTVELAFNNTVGGNMLADNGTFRVDSSVFLSGATLNSANGGVFNFLGNGDGATLEFNVTNNGTAFIQSNALVTLKGTLTNNGSIYIGGSGLTPTGIQSFFDMTFNGTGQIVLQSQTSSIISTPSFLNNNASHTIRGVGTLSSSNLFNGGTIAADQSGGTLAVTGDLINLKGGTVSVSSGATLTATQLASSGFINIAGGGTLTAGEVQNVLGPIQLGTGGGSGTLNVLSGVLPISSDQAVGTGSLSGNGVVNASVTLSGNAAITPGTATSAGSITINGDLIAGTGTHLGFKIGGTTPGTEFDTLFDTTASFAGLLDVSLLGSYRPSAADSFVIITSTGIDTGSFSNVANGQRITTTDGLGSFLVTYLDGGSTVTLSDFLATTAPIPEPTTAAIGAAGTLLLVARRNRRLTPKM